MEDRKLRQYQKLIQDAPERFRQGVGRYAPDLADWALPVVLPELEEAVRLTTDCLQERLRDSENHS